MTDKPDIRPDSEPGYASRGRVRDLLMVAAPVVVLFLVLGGFLGLTFYDRDANRRDVLGLTEDVVRSLDQRVRSEVEVFMRPAEQAVRLTGELAGRQRLDWSQVDAVFERFALAMMRSNASLAAFYVADPDGRFTMVRRNDKGWLDTKRIAVDGGQRTVTVIRRGPGGGVLGTESDPSDRFQATSRPWFQGAVESKDVFWSNLYVFFSSQQPGITAALAVRVPGGEVAYVVGVDIELAQLSRFLNDLEIGRNGKAVIMESDGQVFATPNPADAVVRDGDGLRPARIEDLADPVLRGIFDRVRVQRDIHRVVGLGSERYVVAASSLERVLNRPLWLIISAPEASFTSFLDRNSRNVILASGLLVLLSLPLVGLLVALRVSVQRRERDLLYRRAAMNRLGAELSALSGIASTESQLSRGTVRRVTESVAQAVAARRVSVWSYRDVDEALVCMDCYDREHGGHTDAAVLGRSAYPHLFEALESGEPLYVPEAESDSRTQALYRNYLQAVGAGSLAAVPVLRKRRLMGALWVEDATAAPPLSESDVIGVAGYAAGIIRPALSGDRRDVGAMEAGETAAGAANNAPPATKRRRGVRSATEAPAPPLVERVRRRWGDTGASGTTVYPNAAVLWFRISEVRSPALSGPAAAWMPARVELAERVRAVASELGIPLVRLLGEHGVLADGLDRPLADAVRAIGRAALTTRAECEAVFARHDLSAACRAGIAVGPLQCVESGTGAPAGNLWGESLNRAETLANSAPDGGIQLGESASDALREDFAIRFRGLYYEEGVGEVQTYLLQGEI